MSGFFLMHRGWRDSPVFQDEPCSEREAWVWLIEEAAYQSRRKRVGGVIISVKRGQIAASTRFLAEAWGWTHSKARRFLDRLENDAMIGTSTDTGVTLVTICNYEKYQVPEQAADTPESTGPAQDRHSSDTNEKERKEREEEREDNSPVAGAMGEGALTEAAPGSDHPEAKASRKVEVVDLFGNEPTRKNTPSGTRLPPDWSLPPAWKAWAVEHGLDPPQADFEGEKFADYWHGQAGARGRKADWAATWRTWVRREMEGRNGHRPHRETADESRNRRRSALGSALARRVVGA